MPPIARVKSCGVIVGAERGVGEFTPLPQTGPQYAATRQRIFDLTNAYYTKVATLYPFGIRLPVKRKCMISQARAHTVVAQPILRCKSQRIAVDLEIHPGHMLPLRVL